MQSSKNARPQSPLPPAATRVTPWRVAMMTCAVLGALLFAAPALACPDCAVGIQARSDVWSQDFWFNLLVAVMPFLVIGAACIYVEERDGLPDTQASGVDDSHGPT